MIGRKIVQLGRKLLLKQFDFGNWEAFEGESNHHLPMERLKELTGPNSIDVTLSKHFKEVLLKPRAEMIIDVYEDCIYGKSFESKTLLLYPSSFFLGCTAERFICHNEVVIPGFGVVHCAPQYEGRSSLGRIGVGSHVTAGFGDWGFQGCFTLELFNVGPLPVRLYAGMRIGQIHFDVVVGAEMYDGHYQSDEHNHAPVVPKLCEELFK